MCEVWYHWDLFEVASLTTSCSNFDSADVVLRLQLNIPFTGKAVEKNHFLKMGY